MEIALVFFKFAVMIFSGGMTVYSVNDAFGGGWVGGAFGAFALFLFEGAAMYWQYLSKRGREGQVIVSIAAQWITMGLSLMSTLVGIALLTTWGDTIRDAMPLGQIMIGLIGAGMAINMFGFLAYEDAEPEALRENIERMISAGVTALEVEGKKRAAKSAQSEMEKHLRVEAPILGREIADRAMAAVRGSAGTRQLQAPKDVTPWKVQNPAMAAGGGVSNDEEFDQRARPSFTRPPSHGLRVRMSGPVVRPMPGTNPKPAEPIDLDNELWQDDPPPAPVHPFSGNPRPSWQLRDLLTAAGMTLEEARAQVGNYSAGMVYGYLKDKLPASMTRADFDTLFSELKSDGFVSEDEVTLPSHNTAPAHAPKATAPRFEMGPNGTTRPVWPNTPRRTTE